MASFCLSQCDGLKWMDRVVFGAASSNSRASEKCPPRNEKCPPCNEKRPPCNEKRPPCDEKRPPCDDHHRRPEKFRPREPTISHVAPGSLQTLTWDRNFWPLTSWCSVADGFINPNYEDYCPGQICVSEAVRLPKCPFSKDQLWVRWGTACENSSAGHGKAKVGRI